MQERNEDQNLMQLENPYSSLGTFDALTDKLDVLNKLEPADIKRLVSKIVQGCPNEEMDEFGLELRKLQSIHSSDSNSSSVASEDSEDDDQDFLASLRSAFEVKRNILALLEPNDHEPHRILLSKTFELDCFNEFSELAFDVLGDKGTILGDRLAQTTPPEHRSDISKLIGRMFSKAEFVTQIRAVFELKSNQEKGQAQQLVNSLQKEEPELNGKASQNGLFSQAELRQRIPDSAKNPQKFQIVEHANFLNIDEEESCCEKICTLF